MRNLTVSTGATRETSRLTRKSVSWESVKKRLGTHARMSVTMAEYLALDRDTQTAHKDRGYYVLGAFSNDIRRNEEFEFRDAVVLDIDDAPVDVLMRLASAYRGVCETFIHSTTKHQAHKPRFRVVMPTDRPMSPVEFEALSRGMAAKLDIALVDPISFRAAQMVFFPVVPSDAPVFTASWEGPWLPVDATLDALYLDWRDRGEWPRKKGDVGGLVEARKLGDPRDKPGLIGAFCRAYDIHRALDDLLPGVYEGEGERRRFAQSEGGAGAAIYNDGHWFYSNHTGHDPAADGHSHNAYDLVRIHRFGGDDTQMRAFAAGLDDVVAELPAPAGVDEVFEEVEHVDLDTGEITRKMVPVSEGLFAAIAACMTPDDLRGSMVRRVAAARLGPLLDSQLCKAIADRLKAIGDVATTVSAVKAEVLASRRAARREEDDGEGVDYISPLPVTTDKGMPKACWENLQEIVRRLGLVVRYNVMTKREEVLIPGVGFSQDNRDNAALALVKSECAKFNMPTGDVIGQLTLLADRNHYNPMATWISSKPWDGVDRVAALCDTVVVEPGAERLRDTMIRRWLIAAVACAFEPDGVAAQGVLVFQGAQGIGKSTWLTKLAPDGMAADGVTLKTDNADSKREVLSRWLVELAELDATFRKSDIESLKAFLTRKCDEIRAPYAAKASMWSRRTVFFASVNPKRFLHDTTGNRRFWVVPVLNIKRVKIDMQQMWAQIKTEYESGARYTLSDSELEHLNGSNETHRSAGSMETMLQDTYEWGAERERWVWKTRKQIMADCGIRGEPSVRALADLASTLDSLGCARKKVRGVNLQVVPPLFVHDEEF